MDIAKIRKKVQEKDKGGKAAESASPQDDGFAEGAAAAEVKRDALDRVPEKAEIPFSAEEQRPEAPDEGYTSRNEGEDEITSPTPAVKPPVERKEEPGPAGGILELLTFGLGNEEFAFRLSEVEEIIRFQNITRVPTMPPYVIGITSLRGKIIPVLDLKTRLALGGSKERSEGGAVADERVTFSKILILSGPHGAIGATVEKVLGVVRFDGRGVVPPPAHLAEEERRFIEGIMIHDKRFISIIRTEEALHIDI